MELYFKSKWEKGEIHEYRFVKTKSKVKNGIEDLKKETSKIVEV